mmetsp:Transcript_17547/g.42849  ORF Transcript_17547/g.42849 Transcript_17547/m.42849 type:complete len:272 (-) Transcript_17547:5374-6189(-)
MVRLVKVAMPATVTTDDPLLRRIAPYSLDSGTREAMTVTPGPMDTTLLRVSVTCRMGCVRKGDPPNAPEGSRISLREEPAPCRTANWPSYSAGMRPGDVKRIVRLNLATVMRRFVKVAPPLIAASVGFPITALAGKSVLLYTKKAVTGMVLVSTLLPPLSFTSTSGAAGITSPARCPPTGGLLMRMMYSGPMLTVMTGVVTNVSVAAVPAGLAVKRMRYRPKTQISLCTRKVLHVVMRKSVNCVRPSSASIEVVPRSCGQNSGVRAHTDVE